MTEERKRLYVSWRHYFNDAQTVPKHWPCGQNDGDSLAYLLRIAEFNGLRLNLEWYGNVGEGWRIELEEYCAEPPSVVAYVKRSHDLEFALWSIVRQIHEYDAENGTFHETFDLRPEDPYPPIKPEEPG